MNINPQSGMGFGNQQNSVSPSSSPAESQNQEFAKELDVKDLSNSHSAHSAQDVASAEGSSRTIDVKKTWQMSAKDILQQLVSLGIPNPKDGTNRMLAMLMLQNGLELSTENFKALHNLLKGKTKTADLQAAVLSLSKGLQDIPESTQLLSSFLSRNQLTATQMNQVLKSLQQLQLGLSGSQILDKGIIIGISAMLSELDDEFKKLLKKASGEKLDLGVFRRNGLIRDLYSLNQFFQGLHKKFLIKQKDPEMYGKMESLQEKMNSLLGSLVAQVILSKNAVKEPLDVLEKFAYWQIPNILGVDPNKQNVDLLIKKGPANKGEIDPEQTKMIIRLETPELGEVVINLTVMDKKLWYVFHAEHESATKMITSFQNELKNQMESIDYYVVGFQSLRRKVDIYKYLMPTQNLDGFVRINAQV